MGIDIRDHGGGFGGGKYRKGSDVYVSDTDIGAYPISHVGGLGGWNQNVYHFRYNDDLTTCNVHSAGSYYWLAGPNFTFCPNSTQTAINYLYKLNGVNRFIYIQGSYLYSFVPPSEVVGTYVFVSGMTTVHHLWEVGNYLYIWHDYNKITIITKGASTGTVYATRTFSNITSAANTVYNVVEHNGSIYAKMGGYLGPLVEFPMDLFAATTPAATKVTANFYGRFVDVSDLYVAVWSSDTNKIQIRRRSDFVIVYEVPTTLSNCFYFDEKSMTVSQINGTDLQTYNVLTGAEIFRQKLNSGGSKHHGAKHPTLPYFTVITSSANGTDTIAQATTVRRTFKILS